MNDTDMTYDKLKVSAILFKHKVPVEDAKFIGTFIMSLEQEIKKLQREVEWYKQAGRQE